MEMTTASSIAIEWNGGLEDNRVILQSVNSPIENDEVLMTTFKLDCGSMNALVILSWTSLGIFEWYCCTILQPWWYDRYW